LLELTIDQKQIVLNVINDFYDVYFTENPKKSKYTTEYDILMKKKDDEFKQYLLKDKTSCQIDALMEMCNNYLEEKASPEKNIFGAEFGIIIKYDMWLNKSAIWPVYYNPEWKEWDKLKKKKVRIL
jgi:hypothetical protein